MHIYAQYNDRKGKRKLSITKLLPRREYGLSDQCYDLNSSHYDAHLTIWVTEEPQKRKETMKALRR